MNMYANMGACAHTYSACKSQGITPSVVLSHSPVCFLRQGLSMTLDLTNSAGWTTNSRDLCVFPSQLWDYRYLLPFPDFHTCAGDRAQVLMLTQQTLPIQSSPQP